MLVYEFSAILVDNDVWHASSHLVLPVHEVDKFYDCSDGFLCGVLNYTRLCQHFKKLELIKVHPHISWTLSQRCATKEM